MRDKIFFRGALSDTVIAFGCDTSVESWMSKYTRIDGLVGFGHGSYTFHAQLATAGTINQNVFGLCNAGFESPLALVTLGKFDFGDDMPVLGQTHHYCVEVNGPQTKVWPCAPFVVNLVMK